MSIDLGDIPIGTPPTSGEKSQIRDILGVTSEIQALSTLTQAAMTPVYVVDAAERKALTGLIVGMSRVIQADLIGIIWNLVAADATLDASWIGLPYTVDPDGDVVVNMQLADATGIVPDANVLGQDNGNPTIGDAAKTGGRLILTEPIDVVDTDARNALDVSNYRVGQMIQVTGEGNRIERWLGPGNEGIKHRGSMFVSGGTIDRGDGVFADPGDKIIFDPDPLGNSSGTLHGNNWSLKGQLGGSGVKWEFYDSYYSGQTAFESTEDADTIHPADATWVAVGDGLTVPTFARIPASVENNWDDVVPTYELTYHVTNGGHGGVMPNFDGVEYAAGQTVVGWVKAGPVRKTHDFGATPTIFAIDDKNAEYPNLLWQTTSHTSGIMYLPYMPKVRELMIECEY